MTCIIVQISELDKLNIGYIQIARHLKDFDANGRGTTIDTFEHFRPLIKNSHLFFNVGLTGEESEALLESEAIDAAVIGRPFIANPNLPELIQSGGKLQDIKWANLYTPGEVGYTDY